MIKELVIHLGDTKTGSTSIQKTLVQGTYKIPGASVTYPTRMHHNGLAVSLYKKRYLSDSGQRFKNVYKAFQNSDDQYGIISAELFQMVDPQVLRQAIDTHLPDLKDRIRLVAYVRPHAGRFLSGFAERARLGSMVGSLEESFDLLSETPFFEFSRRFEKWREVFGDRFELRPFVRDRLYQGDAVADFFKYLCGSENFEITGSVAANPSLTLSQLALLREVHKTTNEKYQISKRPRLREAQSALGRIVAETMCANGLGKDGDRLRMPAALAERFKAHCAADAKALDAAFFDGSPMAQALEDIHLGTTDVVQSLNAADYFSTDVINTVHVFTDVLAGVMVEKPNHFKQAIARIRANADISA